LHDDTLLHFFGIVGQILKTEGRVSQRVLAERLADMKRNGTLPAGVGASYGYVRKALDRLEKRVAKRAGKKSVQLIARDSELRSKGGLTKDGERLLSEITKHFAAQVRSVGPP
jgi:hypothetical protein